MPIRSSARPRPRPTSCSPRSRRTPNAWRAAAQREVDDLTRQKDSIASHLAQVRQLFGGQLPGMETAVQAKPAIAAGAAPPGTPRDGTSGLPAPATMQAVSAAEAARD